MAVTRILLIRHGHAGDRGAWTDDDRLRPLSPRGLAQAEGLVGLFDGYRIEQIVTSVYARCRQTVEPLASARHLAVAEVPWLAEGADPAVSLSRLIAAGAVAGCSHGDVISGILFDLAAQGVNLGENPRMQKGSTWLLGVEAGLVASARYQPPPL